MKWIDSTDLRSWAGRRDCQETLPLLIRKLIRVTSRSINSIKFPSGDNIQIGGWDGILEISDGTEYLPQGTSLWEFGANTDVKGKANDDYIKRTTNPIGFKPAECTFIFVTPRLWAKSSEWIDEKKRDGVWKDIKVINSETLEEWIEEAPSVGSWLAVKHFGKFPNEGIQPTEDFWDEWSRGTKINLTTEIITSGRTKEVSRLLNELSEASLTSIEGTSRDEAIAFIIASFKGSKYEEDFFARSLIVDSPDSFRKLSVLSYPLILLPRFEDIGVFNRATAKSHKVLVPIGPDSPTNWSRKIVLPKLDRELFIASLENAGVQRELAEKYSKESARNITILRRQLEFERSTPKWATPDHVREIIPSLIVGRWNEEYESDKAILSKVANEDYDEYIKKLSRWLHSTDSPIVKIGSSWRLASPLDAWTNAAKFLTKNDFDTLKGCSIEVLTEIDPAFDLEPEKRYMSVIYGKKRLYSQWLREGITQSLILVSLFGNQLKFDLHVSGDIWVDTIITKILDCKDLFLWKSIEGILPLIAEASPNAFLTQLEKHIILDKSPIAALFEEDPGFMTGRSYHTGLLWALESLAWLPNTLSRSSLILAKLASIDPGGTLTNRPINSLVEIFKPWHYQTFSSLSDRLEVLRLISKKEPEIAWTLLIRLLPDSHGSAFPTHKLRWKWGEFEGKQLTPVTYKEIWETHSLIIDVILSVFDFSEEKTSTLLKETVNLSTHDREKVLTFIEVSIKKIETKRNLIWHCLRNILSHHRSYPDAEWAMSENELKRYENLFNKVEPQDVISNVIWMFDNDHWPQFAEGYNHKLVSIEKQEALIKERQIKGLKKIIDLAGIQEVVKLSKSIKQPWALGDTLAYVVTKEEDITLIYELLNQEKEQLRFIHAFVYRMSLLNGFDWVVKTFKRLKFNGYNDTALAQLFVPLEQNSSLWDYIDSIGSEIKEIYWQDIYPRFFHVSREAKIKGLGYLIEVHRFFSAIDICNHFVEDIPTQLIIEILEKAATYKASEPFRLTGYELERLFSVLDQREDLDLKDLTKLEWMYLPALASYGSNRKPKILHEELAKNPEFFIEVVKWAYRPDNDDCNEEKSGISEEQFHNRAIQAFQLLNSWKVIPGVSKVGRIDKPYLFEWVNAVRVLGEKLSRLGTVDSLIGQVLAHYPEKINPWPPDEICEILEKINTSNILSNFSASTSNKRSSSVRGAYDGGDIERKHAKYFKDLANQHRNKYPIVSNVLAELSRRFEERGKSIDEQVERDKLEY